MKRTLTIVALISGIMLMLQVRSFRKVELLLQRSEPASVLSELRLLQLANEQTRAQIIEQEKVLTDLESKVVTIAVEKEIKKLRLLAGQDAVVGEGIEITLSKNVNEFWITDLVAQLMSAGGEAVAINDVRLTYKNAGLRTINDGLLIGRSFLKTPLRISVIGQRSELHDAISQDGGIIDRMEQTYPGLTIIIGQREKIVIPALS